MPNIRISLGSSTLRMLHEMINRAQYRGDLRTIKRVNAVLAVANGHPFPVIASILNICGEALRLWMNAFMLKGPEGLISKRPPGRQCKLTKSQKQELDALLTAGPSSAGFPGACWRSPMIQRLIHEKFGIFYSVGYIAQLLKNMGYSYQKAAFVSDHKNPEKRKEWIEKSWPEIIKLAKAKQAAILFGDERSFPQWVTLTYTWAKRGQQSTIKTSGIRKPTRSSVRSTISQDDSFMLPRKKDLPLRPILPFSNPCSTKLPGISSLFKMVHDIIQARPCRHSLKKTNKG